MSLDPDMMGLGLLALTLVYSLISGVFPLLNMEIYLLSAAALAPTELLPLLAVTATTGQVAAKVLIYFAGAGVATLPWRRLRDRLARARERVETWKRKPGILLFVSASVGLPPFFLVSVAAGALRVGLTRFLVLGFLGRLTRFAVVLALPQLFL